MRNIYSRTIFILLFCIYLLYPYQHQHQYQHHYSYTNPETETFKTKHIYKYTLSLLIIAKNESMILDEFIEHYKWQGVEHIYFIDNDSTDNTLETLQKYIDSTYVTYYYLPKKHKQMYYYNIVYENIRLQTKWLIVCDADEYMYNRTRNDTLFNYVKTLHSTKINSITIPWKMFGSSDFVYQPSNIRKSFLWRKKDTHKNVKAIVRTKNTKQLNIHEHKYLPNTITISGTPQLALNHYPIMSQEYFSRVKMNRGSANDTRLKMQNIRNEKYFEDYDYKEEFDDELKKLLE
jgi:glycosyltransferase involved in cell wall biosynthesis